MNQGDVVFVNPASLRDSTRTDKMKDDYPYPPTGLLTMSGMLMMHGYQPVVIDFFREDLTRREKFVERLRSTGVTPKLVGVCAYTETIYDAGKIAAVVREVFPETKIVFGGPHATFCYEEILADFPWVDFVGMFEGESVLVELLEHVAHPEAFPLEKVAGLAYRDRTGSIRVNDPYGPIVNLDMMPFPPAQLIPPTIYDDGSRVLILLSSRGCPGSCVFCASRALSGSDYRFHSADWLLGLVHHTRVEGDGFDSLGVLDDTFLADYDRLSRFIDGLAAMDIDVPWTCKSRVDTLDEESVKLLSEANCKSVHLGIESGDDDVLRSIGKGITVDDCLEVIYQLKKYGMRPECSFIIGHYSDTKATIEKTVLLATGLRDANIAFSVVGVSTPLPGTALLRHADKLGIRIVQKDWRYYDMDTPIYDTEHFDLEDLENARYYFDVESKFGGNEFELSKEDLTEFKSKIADFVERVDAQRLLAS